MQRFIGFRESLQFKPFIEGASGLTSIGNILCSAKAFKHCDNQLENFTCALDYTMQWYVLKSVSSLYRHTHIEHVNIIT